MNKLKVLHIASFNGNIGDNANHNGLRRKLESAFNVNIQFEEIEMREFYQTWGIRDFNSSEFITKCNNYNLVIIGGGNFFELKWDYSYTGTTINISNETLRKIKTPILFFGLGCDIGKGTNRKNINKFDEFLENLTGSNKYLVSVRNDGSFDTITNLYGNKYIEKIHKVSDGAFFIDTNVTDYAEINNQYKSIGINVVSDMKSIRFDGEFTYNDFIDEFAEVINSYLLKNNGYQIILFPHIYSDLVAISDLLDKIDDKVRRKRIVVAPCLTGSGAENYIFGLYKKCDFILGMRFHSNVCAIAQNIPTIALCSYKKIHDLYSELDLLDRIVYVNKRGFNKKLVAKMQDTIENLDSLKYAYSKINQNLDKESDSFFQIVKEWAVVNKLL